MDQKNFQKPLFVATMKPFVVSKNVEVENYILPYVVWCLTLMDSILFTNDFRFWTLTIEKVILWYVV